ncbi:hypothetical protein ACFVWX_29120 [Streptomyces sp. NPDC058220]|uniref:hypothetical protein n=1 Tax=Streptomyces sp. NPDC058220 TaxID=3346387 RepID=UPI0036EC5BEA
MSTHDMHLAAVTAMADNAVRTAQVARRLLADHVDLPELLDVRLQPTETQARVDLQPRISDVRLWAERLGIELRFKNRPDSFDDRCGQEHADGTTEIAGVTVTLGAMRFIEREEWAAIQAEQPTAVSA